MSKKLTRQQIAGTQGEAFVSERAGSMGFLSSPYGPPEAGIDGLDGIARSRHRRNERRPDRSPGQDE